MVGTRYTFTGTLELQGALHIGSGGGGRAGQDDTLTDATVVRDSGGRPYIPGSSLRGVLRATVAQLAPMLFGPEIGQLRDDEKLIQALKKEADEGVEQARKDHKDSLLFDEELALQAQLNTLLSPNERLFGTVLWASPLFIPDLHLHREQAVSGEIRHGVGIDRDTGAARENIKYDFEVLPRGASFDFWMRCDVPHQPAEKRQYWPYLLALGLRMLEQGELPLGGRVARGVGQVQMTGLTVYSLDMGNRADVIKALLAANSSPDRYGTSDATWMERTLMEMQHVQPAIE